MVGDDGDEWVIFIYGGTVGEGGGQIYRHIFR